MSENYYGIDPNLHAIGSKTFKYQRLGNVITELDAPDLRIEASLSKLGCTFISVGLQGGRPYSESVAHFKAPWAPSPFAEIECPSYFISGKDLLQIIEALPEDLPRYASSSDSAISVLAARMLELGL